MPDTSPTGGPNSEPAWWEAPAPTAAPDEDTTQRWTALLQTAMDTGFAHADPATDQPWQRLTCLHCGDRLDLPSEEEPGWLRYAVQGCRRVAAYVYRHRPAGEHR